MMPKQMIPALLLGVFLASCANAAQPKAPPDLQGTEWLLEDLAGRGVLDRIQATLAFPGPNQVAGNGSCNRFFGGVKISGELIKFDPLASTRMACLAEAVSNQEADYLKALEGAERIVMDGPYLLIYTQGTDKPLRFTQMEHAKKP
jgi:heat shock protein HslJ